jgi:hypothetical protein
MIVLLGDPHCRFGMRDALVEPAELGKRVAKRELRHCRLDHGRSETLSAQLAVESDVPLEQFDCFGVLAPVEVRVAKIGVATTSMERSLRVCAMASASCPDLRAASKSPVTRHGIIMKAAIRPSRC